MKLGKFLSFSGFSLVELLVVMGVVGVLSGIIVFLNPTAQLNRGEDTKRKADLSLIRSALESYYQDFGDYPGAVNACTVISAAGNTTIKDALEPAFIKKLPRDPQFSASTDYMYWHNAAREYKLYAVLENTTDPLIIANLMTVDSVPTGSCTGYAAGYNYRVINP